MLTWKKWLSVGVATSLVFTLGACGQGGNEGVAGEGGKVTITYAHGKDSLNVTERLIKAFEKKHPDIEVKEKEMPSDTGLSHDQYVTMFSAGSSEVDVFDLDVIWPAEFAQAGYLAPLDRLIEKDGVDLGKYAEGAVKTGQYNGKQWAMPRYQDQGLLYYRKDLVKEPPTTWDELTRQAKDLEGKGGTQHGYIMQGKQYEGLVCNFIEFLGAYGGEVLDERGNVAIDSPEAVKGLQKMSEIAKSDFVPGNLASITEVETDALFGEGEAVFDRQWPSHYAYVQDEEKSEVAGKVGVTTLPEGDAGTAAALGGWMGGINKNSKHKQAAWEFIKFVTGPEGQKISAIHGGVAPTYLPLYDDKEVQQASPLFANKDYVEGVKSAIPRPISPEYPKISDTIQVEVSKTLAGKQSPQEAVKNMDEKLKEVIQ